MALMEDADLNMVAMPWLRLKPQSRENRERRIMHSFFCARQRENTVIVLQGKLWTLIHGPYLFTLFKKYAFLVDTCKASNSIS